MPFHQGAVGFTVPIAHARDQQAFVVRLEFSWVAPGVITGRWFGRWR
ncbi:MAG: hypothetical protein KGN74_10080 [Gemmatimonadota bacterium]|nr:hypothetical protein [Gemmatimonadota bacterium]